MLAELAQAAQPGANLVPLYYAVSILIAIGTAIWGLMKWYDKQRGKWIQEAAHDVHISEELKANTTAAMANTRAITRLTEQLADFAVKVDRDMTAMSNRVARLEEYAQNGTAPWQTRKP